MRYTASAELISIVGSLWYHDHFSIIRSLLLWHHLYESAAKLVIVSINWLFQLFHSILEELIFRQLFNVRLFLCLSAGCLCLRWAENDAWACPWTTKYAFLVGSDLGSELPDSILHWVLSSEAGCHLTDSGTIMGDRIGLLYTVSGLVHVHMMVQHEREGESWVPT